MSQRIVIVGAGHAAGEFCAALMQDGFDGSITLFGDEPHLPYQRPPLSKAYLTGEMDRDRLFLRGADFYETHAIALKPNVSVTAINRGTKTVTTSDGSEEPYDTLVLMTGARVRHLSCPGADLGGVRYVRSIADADALGAALEPGQTMVVIGGGYIGLEVAASARKLGLAVSVVEMAPRLLARVASAEFSSDVHDLHTANGVSILCETGVAEITGNGDGQVTGVRLADKTVLDAHHVVVGIGVMANEEIATQAGLKTNNGILVDAAGRTSDPSIFAAGDVARFDHKLYGSIRLESVQNAVEQAKICADTIRGTTASYDPVPWFWSDQYDAKIQLAGLSAGYDRAVRRAGKRPGSGSIWLYREGALIAVEALSDAPAYMMGKRWLEEGQSPDPERIADTDIKIKDVV